MTSGSHSSVHMEQGGVGGTVQGWGVHERVMLYAFTASVKISCCSAFFN